MMFPYAESVTKIKKAIKLPSETTVQDHSPGSLLVVVLFYTTPESRQEFVELSWVNNAITNYKDEVMFTGSNGKRLTESEMVFSSQDIITLAKKAIRKFSKKVI